MKNTMMIALAAMMVASTTAFALPQDAKTKTMDKMDHSMAMQDQKMTDVQKSTTFKGIEVNAGSAMLYKGSKDGKWHLRWSDDFKVPGTPAPHWQVVDGNGNTYLLNRLSIKDDKQNRDITLPSYIKSVSKVQIWCSFVEVVLGEAKFDKMMELN